jgi:hypothetical protein
MKAQASGFAATWPSMIGALSGGVICFGAQTFQASASTLVLPDNGTIDIAVPSGGVYALLYAPINVDFPTAISPLDQYFYMFSAFFTFYPNPTYQNPQFFDSGGNVLPGICGYDPFACQTAATVFLPGGVDQVTTSSGLYTAWYIDGDFPPVTFPGTYQLLINLPFSTTTPIPPALPLFATGLAVIGWFGWRRGRQAMPL